MLGHSDESGLVVAAGEREMGCGGQVVCGRWDGQSSTHLAELIELILYTPTLEREGGHSVSLSD